MNDVFKHSVSRRKTSASSRIIAWSMAPSWAHLKPIILSTKMCFTYSRGSRPGSKWSFTANPMQRQQTRSAISSKTISLTMATPSPSHPSWSRTKKRRCSWMASFRCRKRRWATENRAASWRRQLSAWRVFQWKQSSIAKLPVTLTASCKPKRKWLRKHNNKMIDTDWNE